MHSFKLVRLTSSKGSFPNSPRQGTGVDAARPGLRRNASLKARFSSWAPPVIARHSIKKIKLAQDEVLKVKVVIHPRRDAPAEAIEV